MADSLLTKFSDSVDYQQLIEELTANSIDNISSSYEMIGERGYTSLTLSLPNFSTWKLALICYMYLEIYTASWTYFTCGASIGVMQNPYTNLSLSYMQNSLTKVTIDSSGGALNIGTGMDGGTATALTKTTTSVSMTFREVSNTNHILAIKRLA